MSAPAQPADGEHAAPQEAHRPLRALWRRHRRHRPRVVAAVTMSVVNSAADVAPEVLLAAAIDVSEAQLRAAVPIATMVFIEPDIRHA